MAFAINLKTQDFSAATPAALSTAITAFFTANPTFDILFINVSGAAAAPFAIITYT